MKSHHEGSLLLWTTSGLLLRLFGFILGCVSSFPCCNHSTTVTELSALLNP